jgi:cytochrome c biogenesis protein CcdA
MDGVLVVMTTASVTVLVIVTRAAVLLSVLSVVSLLIAAVVLLRRRGQVLCRRMDALPPDPLRAVSAGFLFSLTGCPGCAPFVIAVGVAAASTSALLSPVVMVSFLAGRAASLYAVAAVGGAWLAQQDPRLARRVDTLVAVVLILAAAYTTYRLAIGDITTYLPGDEGVLA